jgi:hypothetical protein
MDIVQAYFALRLEGKNEEALLFFSPDAVFETPKEKFMGLSSILAFIRANPANAKVGKLYLFSSQIDEQSVPP